MKNFIFKKFALVLFIAAELIFGFAGGAQAQISLRAYVDKNTVALDGYVILSVEVSGSFANISKPVLPSLANFGIYSSGQTQNVRFINGNVSSSITYKYTLVPRFTGKAKINAVTLNHEGQDYTTNPIEITVLKAGSKTRSSSTSAASISSPKTPAGEKKPRGKDVFLTAWTDKKDAFVGEQITLVVRFYHAVAILGNPDYIPPKSDKFINEDLPPNASGVENINGRDYHYIEVKSALFGATAGNALITPAEVVYRLRKDANFDPFADDFISQFFSSNMTGAVTAKARTKPISIEIKPLPKSGRPKNFNGAVGRYKISASLDKTSLKVGELANVTIAISGTGNLKTIIPVKLPELSNIHVYDTVSSLNVRKENNVVKGAKTFKTVISPKATGSFIISPLHFSYFDPNLETYVKIASSSLKLEVLPSKRKDRVKYTFTAGEQGSVTALDRDINYIREDANLYKSGFLLGLHSLGRINFISVFIVVLGFCVYLLRRLFGKNPNAAKHRKAYKTAIAALKRAEKLTNANEIARLMPDILNSYICAKVKTWHSAMTKRELIGLLRKKYPATCKSAISSMEDFWNHLDMRKFAPMSEKALADSREIIKDLKAVLVTLERELKK
jgi:hypothetical protein